MTETRRDKTPMTVPLKTETWDQYYARLHRKWRQLGKLAKRLCEEGYGHKMGPLHRRSAYDRMEHTRAMRCTQCRFEAWVKLTGELQGLPTYKECPTKSRGGC
jgi:hypothetical protein